MGVGIKKARPSFMRGYWRSLEHSGDFKMSYLGDKVVLVRLNKSGLLQAAQVYSSPAEAKKFGWVQYDRKSQAKVKTP